MEIIESRLKKNDVVLCPIWSIGKIMRAVSGEVLLHEIVQKNERWFMKYRIDDNDLKLRFRDILLKLRFFCTALSVSMGDHFWVEDVLLNEELKIVWKGKRSIRLEVDKEILPSGPSALTGKEFCRAEEVECWIGINYPRVFNYHYIGLFLLRSNFETEYLYADVLLNFFKIVEIVIFSRVRKKPELGVILEEHRKLRNQYEIMQDVEESEIKEFYYIRGRDAAHDHDKVKGVSRRKAIECKLWSEALVMVDMVDRLKGKKVKQIIEVKECDEGASAREIDMK